MTKDTMRKVRRQMMDLEKNNNYLYYTENS